MNVLRQQVLKLNRLWQALDVTTVETALADLCRGACMALDTETMRAVGWDEWITLPIREDDDALVSVRGPVRVPRIILCVRYEGRPKVRPALDNAGIRRRDRSICQVTGEYAPDGNVDHLMPVSRGGAKRSWRNQVWMKRQLNAQKGNRTLEEMGWRLIRPPQEPKSAPGYLLIEPNFPEWKPFLQC
jgi:5-methylcytosine-specific restriction endonuclease McrA